MTARADVWASAAPYEAYVGRWSRLVAAEFVDWACVPSGASWLDVGCGTGALTSVVLARAEPASVSAVDASRQFVDYARSAVGDARATFGVADARSLPFADGSFHATVSGLVLNFVPQPASAVAEMTRVTYAGGTVGVYVWDYAEGMEPIRCFWDAAVELDRSAVELDEGRRFPVARPEPLHDLFLAAELDDVETRAIAVTTRFRDFDDYWSPFLGGQGPAPAYASSLEAERRDALRELLRSRLPAGRDGSISLVARAWAVKGLRR